MKNEKTSVPFKIVVAIIVASAIIFVGSIFASLFTLNIIYVINTFYYAAIVDVVVVLVYALFAALYKVFKEN